MDGSPRTADEPMAFTQDEMWRGAGAAWITFTVLTGFASGFACAALMPGSSWSSALLSGLVGFLAAIIIGGGTSFGVLILAIPVVLLIGRALRLTRRSSVHVMIYATLGAGVGASVAGIILAYNPGYGTALVPISIALTTPPVIFGWLLASREARDELRARTSR